MAGWWNVLARTAPFWAVCASQLASGGRNCPANRAGAVSQASADGNEANWPSTHIYRFRLSATDQTTDPMVILRRLAQGSRIDAQEGQRCLVTKEVGGGDGAFGLGDKPVQGFLNGDETLVEWQGLKFGGGKVQHRLGIGRVLWASDRGGGFV